MGGGRGRAASTGATVGVGLGKEGFSLVASNRLAAGKRWAEIDGRAVAGGCAAGTVGGAATGGSNGDGVPGKASVACVGNGASAE